MLISKVCTCRGKCQHVCINIYKIVLTAYWNNVRDSSVLVSFYLMISDKWRHYLSVYVLNVIVYFPPSLRVD